MASKLTYRQEGDYLIPNLELKEQKDIGRYGRMRLKYLEENRPLLLEEMTAMDTLNEHLYQTNEEVIERIETLIALMKEREKVPPQGTMEWVGFMNNLKARAEEVAFSELIYS